MNPAVGTVLGDRYTLTESIASGGMGEVWAATDSVLGRAVAVKLLNPALSQDPSIVERFRAEARHAAALHHPNITTVFDYDEDGATAYLVMELVAGQPLSQIITERAPLSAQETSSILFQAAIALQAAHQSGVIHLDVKPATILITPDGTAKLTDFGIFGAVDARPLTQTGQILGTAQYLPPEQALGMGATASSDIYALGVVGYEMLTGLRPFEAGTTAATGLTQINEPSPRLPDSVPVGVANVISACLAKTPSDRPASAAAVAQALATPDGAFASALLADPAPTPALPHSNLPAPTQIMATQTTPTEPALMTSRRSRPPGWLLGAATVTLLAALAVFALSGGSHDSKVPVVTGTTPTSTPSSPSPSIRATALVAPTEITSSRPGQLSKSRGNGHDHRKDGT